MIGPSNIWDALKVRKKSIIYLKFTLAQHLAFLVANSAHLEGFAFTEGIRGGGADHAGSILSIQQPKFLQSNSVYLPN
jgi:hypothetical protein